MIFPSQTQAEIPSSLQLQASSTLGTGKATTHKERLERLEDKEVRRALDGRAGKRKRHDDVYAVIHPDNENSDEEEVLVKDRSEGKLRLDVETSVYGQKELTSINLAPVTISQPIALASSAVGSALQRNADGSIMAPKIRPKTKGKKVGFNKIILYII